MGSNVTKRITCVVFALVLAFPFWTLGVTSAYAAKKKAATTNKTTAKVVTKKTGGWKVNPDKKGKMTKEATSAFKEAMRGFVGFSVKPTKLLATQVVNGTNYKILCEVTPVLPKNRKPKTVKKEVIIYKSTNKKAVIKSISDYKK